MLPALVLSSLVGVSLALVRALPSPQDRPSAHRLPLTQATPGWAESREAVVGESGDVEAWHAHCLVGARASRCGVPKSVEAPWVCQTKLSLHIYIWVNSPAG
ncbi:hypothetical protein B0H14DRAFT_2618266 [Mycena olivaceomarginata]|nr:hypothetical protein B0H14DRAFT_2618266 [Mycena olivaceomarginata]